MKSSTVQSGLLAKKWDSERLKEGLSPRAKRRKVRIELNIG